MRTDCFFCHIRTLERQIQKFTPKEEARQQLINEFINQYNTLKNQHNPSVAATIHTLIKKHLNINDPYLTEKKESNKQALKLVDIWKKKLQQTNNKPLQTLKLALAANIIDFGPGHEFNIQKDIEHLHKKPLAIDNSAELFQAINKANNILYLADNAGEIIFDKLFIETLNHPNITVSVRGFPVINDATLYDAEIAGLKEVAQIIHNGNNAPSTLLNRCSKEFLEVYRNADVIISKGQGNFEGLMFENDPRIWFALVAKCDVIARVIGIKKGDTALVNNKNLKETNR